MLKLILSLAISSLASSSKVDLDDIELIANQYYYSDQSPEVKLSCSDIPWSSDTAIVFYENEQIIFDSSSSQKFPKVTRTEDNTRIVLIQEQKTGWELLKCSVNGWNTNKLTIPYFSEIKQTHSPVGFELGQTYTVACEGYVLPTSLMTQLMRVRFNLNDKMVALITGKQLRKGYNPGLEVGDDVIGNNTITFTPTLESNQGNYSCQLDFRIRQAVVQIAESPVWIARL